MSIGGSCYFVTFIDDCTRHTWACLIEKKSEVFASFLRVKSLAERETGRKIKRVRSDGGKEAAWAILQEKHMPKFYWAEAVRIAVYLQNRASANGGVSPHELYFGKKPNFAHLGVFSSIAYVHLLKEKRRKLDAKVEKCILVG